MADKSYIYSYRGPMGAGSEKRGGGKNFLFLVLVIGLGVTVYYLISKGCVPVSPSGAGREELEKVPEQGATGESGESASPRAGPPPKLEMDVETAFENARKHLKAEKFVEARDFARAAWEGIPETHPLRDQCEEILNKANTRLVTSSIPCPEKERYTIKSGDSLIGIAKKFNTTLEALQMTNGLDPTKSTIFPGKTLYIYKGDWRIEVSRDDYKLYLFNGKNIFKAYKIGLGKHGRTPAGEFVIHVKQKDPTWYYEGRAISYGDEENVLGTRWMSLKPVGDTDPDLKGYGIHGTWEPESIGTSSSNGCVRMLNEDVNELYSLVTPGTKVIIED